MEKIKEKYITIKWNRDDYQMYGLPLFKATALKYGWDNPIGEDSGSES
jgi:hypothetical protein